MLQKELKLFLGEHGITNVECIDILGVSFSAIGIMPAMLQQDLQNVEIVLLLCLALVCAIRVWDQRQSHISLKLYVHPL